MYVRYRLAICGSKALISSHRKEKTISIIKAVSLFPHGSKENCPKHHNSPGQRHLSTSGGFGVYDNKGLTHPRNKQKIWSWGGGWAKKHMALGKKVCRRFRLTWQSPIEAEPSSQGRRAVVPLPLPALLSVTGHTWNIFPIACVLETKSIWWLNSMVSLWTI